MGRLFLARDIEMARTALRVVASAVREFPGKSPKNFREIQETSGEVRGLPRSSWQPDSLPATRQICLQRKKVGSARVLQKIPGGARGQEGVYGEFGGGEVIFFPGARPLHSEKNAPFR